MGGKPNDNMTHCRHRGVSLKDLLREISILPLRGLYKLDVQDRLLLRPRGGVE